MGKILHFSACRGEEYFTAPHNTSRRGGFSFTPAPPLPHRQDKTHPAWLHQRPHNTCRLPRLKPMTPMRVDHCHEMKPLTPLLPRNGQFLAIFRPQRRRRFHQTPNRAASSQQDAQTLMLAASAVALIASGSSTVRVCQEIKEAPARCPHRRSPGRHRHLPDAAPRIPRPRRRGPHPPAVLPGLG